MIPTTRLRVFRNLAYGIHISQKAWSGYSWTSCIWNQCLPKIVKGKLRNFQLKWIQAIESFVFLRLEELERLKVIFYFDARNPPPSPLKPTQDHTHQIRKSNCLKQTTGQKYKNKSPSGLQMCEFISCWRPFNPVGLEFGFIEKKT